MNTFQKYTDLYRVILKARFTLILLLYCFLFCDSETSVQCSTVSFQSGIRGYCNALFSVSKHRIFSSEQRFMALVLSLIELVYGVLRESSGKNRIQE